MKHHPSIEHLLQFFQYDHLPDALARISMKFADLANELVEEEKLSGPEAAACLRKLLEAKDCAVRATITRREGEGP